jgi:hypothetical protein
MNEYKLEIDSPIEGYRAIAKYIQSLKGVPGLSCEIGLRRAGGTVVMLDAFKANNDSRTHVCIDPYGNIIYRDIVGAHRSDYTNDMRNQTLSDLYRYANDQKLNVLFFNLEDSEFYHRFWDGVPIYEEEKKIINQYCCVHVDGQHDIDSVMKAAEFFSIRMPINSVIFFDNTDHYDHDLVHQFLLSKNFEYLEDVAHKKIYRKI